MDINRWIDQQDRERGSHLTAIGEATAPLATTTFPVCFTGKVKWFNHIHGYEFITAKNSSYEYFLHRKGILPTAATTSQPTLRNRVVVSFAVEERRKFVGATNVVRFNNGRVFGSFHALGSRTTDAQPRLQQTEKKKIHRLPRDCCCLSWRRV